MTNIDSAPDDLPLIPQAYPIWAAWSDSGATATALAVAWSATGRSALLAGHGWRDAAAWEIRIRQVKEDAIDDVRFGRR